MIRRLLIALHIVTAVLIALGAYGHGFMGRRNIDIELDKFTIAPNVYTMLYVVWYFVSGCMLLFGITGILNGLRLRRGDTSLVPITLLIATLYVAAGVGGYFYRSHDPFMLSFVTLGALLGGSAIALSMGEPRRA